MFEEEWKYSDEYDPRWPNDYEKLVQEEKKIKEKQKQESKVEREKSPEVIAIRSLGLDYDDDDDEDEYESNKSTNRPSVSIAPPSSLLHEVEKVPGSGDAPFKPTGSVAAKIMAKMGYKEGAGLGRDEQGISEALQVAKTSKNQGKIIVSNKPKFIEEQSITEMLKNPSKIVLLRNMVGPGQVDEDLQPETKEECSKYGEVVQCHIQEYSDYNSAEDAVWIFIEFQRVESAVKGKNCEALKFGFNFFSFYTALVDLNGRYFGGRAVKASFYDSVKFARKDYLM